MWVARKLCHAVTNPTLRSGNSLTRNNPASHCQIMPYCFTAPCLLECNKAGNRPALLSVLQEIYFFLAYFNESNATAKMMMLPLMMYCQYGLMPI
jgi:hypothetical protein